MLIGDNMPRKTKKTVDVKSTVDKEMASMGLTYKKAAGIIIAIIGAILVVLNLSGALMVFVGLVLIYFGLKVLGYNIKF